MNYIKGKERNQMRIESIESYVDEDNEVRVIDKIIDNIDIESLGFTMGKNSVAGRASYNPRDLLKLYVYGYLNGIRSSRKLAKQCLINKEVIWLVKDTTPKYRVIADFRKDNVVALEHLFNHFVEYCIGLGLYGKTLIAVDGTKLEASASKRKHYSKNKITKMREIAEGQIKEYLHDIEMADKSEDKENETIDRPKVQKSIANLEACASCENKSKCTNAKDGKVVSRNEFSELSDIIIKRVEDNKILYRQRQCLVEHPFGTLKRNMNFSYLLLRNFEKVRGEISLAFFAYNLKRVMNIKGIKELIMALLSLIISSLFFEKELFAV